MPSSDKMIRSEIRKLARQGRLVDECFKTFQRAVFPGAPPEVIHVMRTCFFAGAAELWALLNAGLDDGDDVSSAEESLMQQWLDEIEAFHARTIEAMKAQGVKQ